MDENKNIFNDDMRKKLDEAVNETLKVFCEVFYVKQQYNEHKKEIIMMNKRRFKDVQTGEIFTLNDIRMIGGVDSNGELMDDEDLEYYIHTLIRENYIVEI